jgi:hypothetical protein
MNCKPEKKKRYLAARIRGWLELAMYGIDRFEGARARRNLRRLTQANPEIAAECGVGYDSL